MKKVVGFIPHDLLFFILRESTGGCVIFMYGVFDKSLLLLVVSHLIGKVPVEF